MQTAGMGMRGRLNLRCKHSSYGTINSFPGLISSLFVFSQVGAVVEGHMTMTEASIKVGLLGPLVYTCFLCCGSILSYT